MGFLNGRLPRFILAEITLAVNGERAYLRRGAARALLAMNAESEARFGVTLRVSSTWTAYRDRKGQDHFWAGSPTNPHRTWKGNLAAVPYTSNHGLGLAVDLATHEMRDIVDRIGGKYGWAKRWSDAPTEWWHLKWKRGVRGTRAPWGYGTIEPGHRGFEVWELKKLMHKRGLRRFDISRTYGSAAVAAIKRYQKKHGLKPDGLVGTTTWRHLYRG